MTLGKVLGMTGLAGFIAIPLVGLLWLQCTIGVLCLMEVCFLLMC